MSDDDLCRDGRELDEATLRRLRRRARLLTVPRLLANLPLTALDAAIADRALSTAFFTRVNEVLKEEGVPPVNVEGTITRRRNISSYGWGHPSASTDEEAARWDHVNDVVNHVVARVCREFRLRSCPPEQMSSQPPAEGDTPQTPTP